ncbi:hypothetical protein T07_9739 [Trichinella nelsoni]|uniref:Uncharacterized protein n=1 Tax=Trichinella nelsoni TaxID=6336 RepID=A0A0V0RNJ2_9BILA|nr:hypothetical protein T07_9739 [Trichinella nelsoni]
MNNAHAPPDRSLSWRLAAPGWWHVLVGIDYYYKLVTGRIRRATGGRVSGRRDPPWLDHVRESRPKTIPRARGLLVERRRLRRQHPAEIQGGRVVRNSGAADGAVALKKLELEGPYENHAGALHGAARCSRITSLGRPKRAFKMSTACV